MSAPARRTALAVALTGAAALLLLAVSWSGAPGPLVLFWAGACVLGEAMWLRLPAGRATLSMGSCFNVAAFMVLPPHEAMLATALASLVAESVFMRKPAERVLFNGAHTMLAVGAAAWTFNTWNFGGPATPIAAFAAAALYYAINRIAVSLAVGLASGTHPADAFGRNFAHRYEAIASGAAFTLGILLGLFAANGSVWHIVIVVLPLFVAFDTYRRFSGRPRLGAVPDRASVREAA